MIVYCFNVTVSTARLELSVCKIQHVCPGSFISSMMWFELKVDIVAESNDPAFRQKFS